MRDGAVQLVWPGKYDQNGVRVHVPRSVAHLEVRERHDGGDVGRPEPWSNLLIHGDNLLALDALLDRFSGAVDLAYIDPPFATGQNFSLVQRIPERDALPGARHANASSRMEELRARAYSDVWPGGPAAFFAMLDARLRRVYELLSPSGCLYVHVDPTIGHGVKLLLDEVFGPESFQREIVWRIGWVSGFKTKARNWIRNHDTIYFYTKDPQRFTFNKSYVPHPPGYRRRDGSLPRGHGIPIDDVWNANEAEFALRGEASLDSIQIKSFSREKTGYATQKNYSLLRRIIEASSNPGDLVADLFCGSGTSLIAAQRGGRRWIGCDCAGAAVHVTRKRLLCLPEQTAFDVCVPVSDSASGVRVHAPTRSPAHVSVQVDACDASRISVELDSYISETTRSSSAKWCNLVDYWAVDWDAKGDLFVPDWHVVRRGDEPVSLTSAPGQLEGDGPWNVCVHVVDVLGGEGWWRGRIVKNGSTVVLERAA